MHRTSIALLAGVLALAGCGGPGSAPVDATATSDPQGLIVEEVLAPDFRTVAAVMTNRDIGDARARIGGRLSRLLVGDGDQVRKGQLVAVIADERIEAEARAAAAAVVAVEATANRARQDLERAEKLYAGEAISRAAIDAARAEAKASEAGLKAARAQAAAAKAAEEQGRVLAPADGRVTRAPVPQGSVVMAGEVVVAISTGAQVLRIELPEADARDLKQGDRLPIIPESDSAEPRSATVKQVYPAVTRGRIMADLDAPGLGAGFIGERVRVAVPLGERRAIIIPQDHIITRYGADYVRLKRATGDIIEAPVQRGAAAPINGMPTGVEILSGIRPGDVVLPAEQR